MTNDFEMVSAARPARNEEGTGAVMEAMKSFYRNIELKDLSKAAQAEIKLLATKEGKSLTLAPIFDSCGAISNYLNWNINLLTRPAMAGVQSMDDAFSLDLFSEKSNQLNVLRASNEENDDKIDDLIALVKQQSADVMYDISVDRFILKEHSDHFEVRFTIGSNPYVLKKLAHACGRTFAQTSIDYRISDLQRNNPALFSEMEDDAKNFTTKLGRIIGVDPTTMKIGDVARGVVAMGYDFSSLWKRSNSGSGEFEVNKSSMPPALANKYGKHWELSIEVRCIADGSASATSAVSALEVVVLPVLNIGREAAWYLTQAQDPKSIRFGIMHTWVTDWQNDVHYGEYKKAIYVNSLQDNFHFSKKKEDLGVKTYDTRADDSGIFVNFEGKFTFAPPTSAVDIETIVAYEAAYEEYVKQCSDLGEPVVTYNDEDLSYLRKNPTASKLLELHGDLNSFQTCALIANWDLNICASIEPSYPAQLSTVNVAGGTKANPVGKADILRAPFSEGLKGLLGKAEIHATSIGQLSAGHHLATVYAYLRINAKIEDIDDFLLLASAEVAANGVSLTPDDFEYGLYPKLNTNFRTLMSDDCLRFGISRATTTWEQDNVNILLKDLSVLRINSQDFDTKWSEFVKQFNRFYNFYQCWSSIFQLGSSTLLRNWEYQRSVASGTPFEGLESSEYYIDPYGPINLLDVMGKKYVVGNAFSKICKETLAYINSPKNILLSHDPAFPKPNMGPQPQLPTFVQICEDLGPFMAAFGNTIPNADDVLKQAEEEQKKFVLDTDRTVSPVPGMKGEFMLLRHQHRALQLLDNEPAAAFLDISPGGGKTVIGIVDCLQLMAKGKVKLPLFVAPNNLVKNWVKEVNETVTDFKFNTIPITGRTLEKWGEKKMAEMIKNAPPNTIFHTDMAFIKDHYRKLQVRFLSFSADIYTNLEWMKQFDWDYILFDESHYLKNAKGASGGSLQSRLFAELTLRDSVKYIRLASGTIIHKDVDDIIGQTRLFDPLIFRTHKDFLTKYSEDEAPGVWAPDAAKRIREHLNRFCAVARAKSRDWAYALPAPKQEHPEKWLVEMDEEFKTVYAHICAKTIEDMQEDEELVKLLKGDSIDDDILDELDPDEDEGLGGKLNVHLSRLEQFLICPENDPLNGWNGLDFSKLKVPKIDKLIELLDEQFNRKGHGKVIVFVRHVSAVQGIYSRLPEKYQSKSVLYSGSDKDGLVAFSYDPNVQIIIGVEHSMNTGENLQIADRIIRMEIPWAAGDVEQGIARIFRPDMHNKYDRQYIYDDWIIVNDSLEIPKLCRLISSTIRKVQFDEYGSENSSYADLPYLPSMSLNLKRFMNPDAAVRRYDQVVEYFDAYHSLSNIQYDEFLQERSRYVDEDGNRIANPYVALEGCDLMPESAQLTFTPLMPHQGFVNDRDGDELKPFHLYISEDKRRLADPSIVLDSTLLVYSEFGFGHLSGLGRSRKGKIPQTATIITSGGEEIEVFTNALYVVGKPGKIKEDRIKKYVGVNNKASNFDQFICPDPRDTDGLIIRDSSGFYAAYKRGEPAKQLRSNRPQPKGATPAKVPSVTQSPTAPKVKVAKPSAAAEPDSSNVPELKKPKVSSPKSKLEQLRERMRLAKLGKVGKPGKVDKAEEQDDDSYVPENTGEDGKLRGSLCVVSDSLYLTFNSKDPDSSPLKNLRFNRVKPFVGIEVKTLLELNAAISYIESKFTIYNADEIYELRKRFSKKTKLFNGQFQPKDNKFLALNYKPIKNPKNIKLYYIIEDGQLFLVFNLEAHPIAAKALLNKKPTGVSSKFEKFDTTLMRSVLSKRAALSVLKKANELVKIVNYDELVEAIGDLTTI